MSAADKRSSNAGRAVVLLSGGLDSTTVLAIAVDSGYRCHTLTLDYGQRHRIELDRAADVARALGVVEHRTVRIDLGQIGGSALTDPNIEVPRAAGDGVPVTYVPARNTVLLAVALGWAEVLGAGDIFIGANAVDYSGYPDCRPEFIEAFQTLAAKATKAGVEGKPANIRAPLIDLSKADIIRTGLALGVDYSLTLSCYDPDSTGRPCGACDACRIRRDGFQAAGIEDPAC